MCGIIWNKAEFSPLLGVCSQGLFVCFWAERLSALKWCRWVFFSDLRVSWSACFLQDYLVLLPSAYYEAPILQFKVTEPCTYSPTQDASQK